MKSFMIFTVLGLSWTKNAFAQTRFTCDPATDCRNEGYAGAVVPDPNNCENYYICLGQTDGTFAPSNNPSKCPEGQFFDHSVTGCSDETTPGSCVNECIGNGSPSCATECPVPFVSITYVADKSNCSHYTVCLGPGPQPATCSPSTPYFNGTNCVTNQAQCCDFCTPYCSLASGQIQDPCDCTSFYLCYDVGIPSTKFSCGSGFYYDETASNCVPGSCTSLCSGSQCRSTGATTTEGSGITTTTGVSVETTSPSTDDCTPLESFTCPNNGNFPRCTYCVKSYFHCTNGVPQMAYCQVPQLFNPSPEYPYCLNPANCPIL